MHRAELIPDLHREAEPMLLSSARVPLRTLDTLHLALATASEVRTILTFDRVLARAAAGFGILTAPALREGD